MQSEHDIVKISERGEWEILRSSLKVYDVIGTGSFGTVHIASWRFTKVAAKILKNSREAFSIVEFRSELQSLSQIRHPNIIQFFGACTLEEPYIILIEYMSRGNLESNNANLSQFEKKEIILDIASGLAYLHNRIPRCVIHRDLKPTNILLNLSGRAKIADFGLSKFHTSHNDTFVMTGETGTYRYMAPEVILHKCYNVSVDIWSFGMILYFMYVGVPFFGMNTYEIVNTVTKESFCLNLPAKSEIYDLISRCTEWEPNNRIHSLEIVDSIRNSKLNTENKKEKKPLCCCFLPKN